MTSTADNAAPTGDSTLSARDLQLPACGWDPGQRRAVLELLTDRLDAKHRLMFGEHDERRGEHSHELAPLLRHPLSYAHDPFEETPITPYTRLFEQAVLDHLARLWKAPPRSDDPSAAAPYWGYVTTMGATEGALYALWVAREYLSGKTLATDSGEHGPCPVWVQDTLPTENPNAYTPVAFHSAETHYSVTKALRMLGIPTCYEMGTHHHPNTNPLSPGAPWPHEVPCQDGPEGPGSVDVDALRKLVEFFAARGHPVLIHLNCGTMIKGAYDDVERVSSELLPMLREHGLYRREIQCGRDENGTEVTAQRSGYWINIDGSLGAMRVPFLRRAAQQGLVQDSGAVPRCDFTIPGVSSIVTSAHKHIGSPLPAGIVMTRNDPHPSAPGQPDAITRGDTLFGGSRNALAPISLWNFLAAHSEQHHIDTVADELRTAQELHRELASLDTEWGARRGPWSQSVWFRKPPQDIVDDFFLPTFTVHRNGLVHEYAYVHVMSHSTRAHLHALLARMAKTAPSAPTPAPTPTSLPNTEGLRNLGVIPTDRRCP
ncbi:histidine decarboxylase [Actinopolyspora biskrensis]|uniref:Histidine decarboxylase n=1 Tax=Actinopolyspora biskrensis TaxID=1470178 RepID=A0A852YT58_9ACTN|nr:histidine decarboxylase [Actinopolyspora biskrensis]NYH77290.1 histidine decarboxylase [Actinopolyspora biskrensis]